MRALFFMLCVCLLPGSLWASHVAGGTMRLILVNGQPVLEAMIYYDGDNGDPQAIVPALNAGIYDFETNATVAQVQMLKWEEGPALVVRSSICNANPPRPTLRPVYYRFNLGSINLPADRRLYVVARHCCRNSTFNNLEAGTTEGITLYLEMPINLTVQTPRMHFLDFPLFCIGYDYALSLSNIDPRDSVSTSIVTPFGYSDVGNPAPGPVPRPLTPIRMASGFTAANPIPGTLSMHANRNTVLMNASLPGSYILGTRTELWRNGQLISVSYFDFPIYVVDCPPQPEMTVLINYQDGQGFVPLGSRTLTYNPAAPCWQLQMSSPIEVNVRPINIVGFGPEMNTITTLPANTPVTVDLCSQPCVTSAGFKSYGFEMINLNCPSRVRHILSLLVYHEPIPPLRVYFNINDIQIQPNNQTVLITGEGIISPKYAKLEVKLYDDAVGEPNITFVNDSAFTLQVEANLNCKWILYNEARTSTKYVEVDVKGTTACDDILIRDRFLLPDSFTPDAIIAPNVFTPNGDGFNDVWEATLPPHPCQLQAVELKVSNRWGQPVFSSSQLRWDGAGFAPGIYYYVATLQQADGQLFYKKGVVQLLR